MEALTNDLRHALCTIRRAPAFSLAVIVTVASIVAANTVMFTVVEGERRRC